MKRSKAKFTQKRSTVFFISLFERMYEYIMITYALQFQLFQKFAKKEKEKIKQQTLFPNIIDFFASYPIVTRFYIKLYADRLIYLKLLLSLLILLLLNERSMTVIC
uniref:Transmembrane protein n=1 Tax=Brugia timori TaxID=42155 RepID=A0A0R3QFV9_9BILA